MYLSVIILCIGNMFGFCYHSVNLTGKKVSDRIKIEDMLKSLQMMSVNQIAAQIKLTEMWKALNDSQYFRKPDSKIKQRMLSV